MWQWDGNSQGDQKRQSVLALQELRKVFQRSPLAFSR